MILIDTVEDIYDLLDDMPDIVYCYDVTENETIHLEVINNDYTYIDKWFQQHKDYNKSCGKPTPLGVGWIAQKYKIMCM